MATRRAPAQENPRKHGNVQMRRNGRAAGAMRSGNDDAFALRNAEDAHVQKTSDDGAEHEERSREKPRERRLRFFESFAV